MIHGTVKSTTWGASNQMIVEADSAKEDVRQFSVGQRVVVTAIPDDVAIKRAYEQGRYDAKMDEHWAVREFLDGRD